MPSRPTAGVWVIDPSLSTIDFSVRHLGISKIRGAFHRFSGSLVIAADIERSTAELSIDAASVSTGDAVRDMDLCGPEFLDVDNHPRIDVTVHGADGVGSRWLVRGAVSAVGKTTPFIAEAALATSEPTRSRHHVTVVATATVDRRDLGITWNHPLDNGGVLVGNDVRIDVELHAYHER